MLSYNEILPKDSIPTQDNSFPINTVVESKPLIILDQNNLLVYSNQAAQITFGLDEIHNISELQTNINFAELLSDFLQNTYRAVCISLKIKNTIEASFEEYKAEIEKIEIGNIPYLLIVFHHTENEVNLENRINSIHAAIEFANLPIMTIDNDGKINFLSQSMEKILGYRIDEVYGKFFCDPLKNFLSKADLLIAERAFFLKQKWVKSISFKDNGNIIYKELKLIPFLNRNNTSNAFMLIAYDITDYVQKNIIIKESEEKLKSIIDNIHDPLFILKRKDGKLFFVVGNNSFFKIFNFDKELLLNKEVKSIFTEKILKQIIENCEILLNDSLPSLEVISTHNFIHYKCNISLMNNQTGDGLFVMVSFNNITDQQNYQSILNVAYKKEVLLNKLKSTFIENISHEIHTPFNAISGYAEIMEESIKANDQKTFAELVVLVKEVLSRVSHLFNNIIDMSEIESREMILECIDLNCNQVIKSVYDKFKYLAKRKNIAFQLKLSQEDLMIKADMEKLEKIIYAITENAIKYTEQGKIVIRTYKLNQFAYITILDTGVGMNQKDIDNLLEPFSQEEQGYTREYQGAGLGLTIAHKLTEMMGGMFKIVSRKETGTKVTLIFPLSTFNAKKTT